MTQIIISDATATQLASLNIPVSICDPSGKLLGTFIPGVSYDPELYARNPSPLTPEERQRRRQLGGGKTLSEFWADMRLKYPNEFK